jgi:cysteine desulfurase family protein
MIYLDNAATTAPKPESVRLAVADTLRNLWANPGRSGHKLAIACANLTQACRRELCSFFDAYSTERVIFTKNCTEALNIAIQGGITGGRVLTSALEHNSTLRPLYTMEKNGLISLTVIEPENNRFITVSDVKKHFSPSVTAVCLNAVSNVTGESANVGEIGEFLKDKNVLFIVDGAQCAGHVKIDIKRLNIDMLAVAGHKGLHSIQGVGALILSKRANPNPIMQGGTGTESFNTFQPDCYPEKLESGTLNLPAICSLEEGVSYAEKNLSFSAGELLSQTKYLIENLNQINGVKCYSTPNKFGIVSFSVKGFPSSEVSEILSDKFDIAVRGGYHCAPLTHKLLKTEQDGLVRVSSSLFNTKRELNLLLSAVRKISCF